MRTRFRPVLVLVASAVALGASVRAQSPAPKVSVVVAVEREVVRVADDGTRVVSREEVRRATPGDVLVYTVRAHNVGDAPALAARVDDPIPAGTVLMLDSIEATRAATSASLDGGGSWVPFPATVTTVGEDGVEREVPAPADRYTHLRWVLDGSLAPGESRDVSFKVRVL